MALIQLEYFHNGRFKLLIWLLKQSNINKYTPASDINDLYPI